MFYLTTVSTHFIYGYKASDVVIKDYIARKPAAATTWVNLFRMAARDLLYAPSHRQDSKYHDFCCTSYRALAGTRNTWSSTKGSGRSTTELRFAPQYNWASN